MKNLLKIATIIAALGLAAAFAGCSNASDGPAPIPTPTPTPTPDPSPTPTTTTPAPEPTTIEYTVTFNSNGGSEIVSQKVTSGQTASKPADPAKDHFNFAGWFTDVECQTLFDFATPITAPTTLYAKWSSLPIFVVTFDLGGGKYGASDSYTQNVESGGKVCRPASDPTKDDNVGADVTTKYAFDNWYADAGCGTLFDFDATAITGPTTVYAKWSETKYCAVKIASGIEHGSVSSDAAEHIAAGTLVTLTASPNIGYEFASYTVTDADSNPVAVTNGKFTMPANPVTVTAVFIVEEIISHIPLTLEAIEAGAKVTFTNKASAPVTYRVNGGDSQTIASGSSKAVTLTNVGDKVSFYGDNATYATSYNEYSNIACDKDCYVYGNIMSLVDSANYESAKKLTGEVTFYGLFKDNVHIKNKAGRDLLLPATTLAKYCYQEMFSGCESLVSAPELPARELYRGCYRGMFRDCASLASAPGLPATTLADNCYESMFSGCASLTSAPALPATTLKSGCYESMFFGCASLASAPGLPATTLEDECYLGMFRDCASLASAPALPATTLAEWCYANMFYGCKSLTSAPALPATTLATACYYSMFYGCTSLASVTCLATDNISASLCTANWLRNVKPTGTFTKAAGMTNWSRGSSGIPEGWTVDDYQE